MEIIHNAYPSFKDTKLGRALKFALIAGLVILVLVLIYSVVVVLKARKITPAVTGDIIASADITYKDLSKWQLDALLAVEDHAFFNHNGIDLQTPGAGITTITQGIAKLLYFGQGGFKPGLAKYKLMLISALALNPMVSKNDQLTLLLNKAYLGSVEGKQAFGFEQASLLYFKKKFRALSNDEYLGLVAMLIAPNTFNVAKQPEANKERVARIKKVISGEYRPKNLMDVYYGKLPEKTVKDGLAAASYFPGMYR